ncbi:hypothetical protein AJ79_05490 [Helicocarpus griseus UAMH5409]|uniref:Uncharacterized protein n=1 Tax=Helicocarpus griseus UAMH5409 TaxID=1447875 RepID=A0A2B7XMS7_9EURO|nr:hypothetical protein AJ79_05490 [Helicocarpus griseus UAMH5409]
MQANEDATTPPIPTPRQNNDATRASSSSPIATSSTTTTHDTATINQSSFADSAVDTDTSSGDITQTPNTTATINPHFPAAAAAATTITERLLRLARLTDPHNNNTNNDKYDPAYSRSSSLSQQKSIAINGYLDNIECLLSDAHDGEIGAEEEKEMSRLPPSTCIKEQHEITQPDEPLSHQSPPVSESEIDHENGKSRQNQIDSELDVLMRDLKSVTRGLEQRRVECLHLNAVFTVKCEKLAQRILELEDQIQELRAEKIENTIELEGLKGTVRGLEGWIRRWKQRQEEVDSESTWTVKESSDFREWDQRRCDIGDEHAAGTIIDGISAWLRGWHDVEEGFRIRARLRKQRETIRQNQQSVR